MATVTVRRRHVLARLRLDFWLPSLIHTVFIEMAVIAAVVVLDAARRRWRRARRAAR